MLSRLPPTAAPSLAGALDHLASTAVDMVAPIFRAAVEAAEERLLRMHTWPGYGRGPSSAGGAGPGGADGDDVVTSTSPHVAEVVVLLADFRWDWSGGRAGAGGDPGVGGWVRVVRGWEGCTRETRGTVRGVRQLRARGWGPDIGVTGTSPRVAGVEALLAD